MCQSSVISPKKTATKLCPELASSYVNVAVTLYTSLNIATKKKPNYFTLSN